MAGIEDVVIGRTGEMLADGVVRGERLAGLAATPGGRDDDAGIAVVRAVAIRGRP